MDQASRRRGGCRTSWCAKVVTVAFATFLAAAEQVARADEITPMLLRESAHDDATGELLALLAALTAPEQRKIEGLYLAFDPSTTEVASLPACDDDGDYVVVMTEGLLRLAESVSFAKASDDVRGSHIIDDYGALLARPQSVTGASISESRPVAPLPPPPSSKAASVAALGRAPAGGAPPVVERAHAIFQDLLLWLMAAEVAHVLAGDYSCPNPTAAHEHADEVWTPSEHVAAIVSARSRMGHQARADAWATTSLLALGRPYAAALAWLDVLAPIERTRGGGERVWYLAVHPNTPDRASTVRSAAEAWRLQQAP